MACENDLQAGDGHWPGDYGGPMFLMPGMLIALYTTRSLDTVLSHPHMHEMIRYFTNHQNEDGGYGLHIEGHSTMFGTVLRYKVQKLALVIAPGCRSCSLDDGVPLLAWPLIFGLDQYLLKLHQRCPQKFDTALQLCESADTGHASRSRSLPSSAALGKLQLDVAYPAVIRRPSWCGSQTWLFNAYFWYADPQVWWCNLHHFLGQILAFGFGRL